MKENLSQNSQRLVLDTNVWLDWLVFDDPSVAPLKLAQREGRIQIIVNTAVVDELRRVLAYPQLSLDTGRQQESLAALDQCTVMHDGQSPTHLPALPRCTDPDDQKFLEAALAAHAGWLITKDRALLELARKRTRPVPFQIATPDDFS